MEGPARLRESEPLLWAGKDGLGDEVCVGQVAPRVPPRGALLGGGGPGRTAVQPAAAHVLHQLIRTVGVAAAAARRRRSAPAAAVMKRTAARLNAAAHRVRTAAAEMVLFRARQRLKKFASRQGPLVVVGMVGMRVVVVMMQVVRRVVQVRMAVVGGLLLALLHVLAVLVIVLGAGPGLEAGGRAAPRPGRLDGRRRRDDEAGLPGLELVVPVGGLLLLLEGVDGAHLLLEVL